MGWKSGLKSRWRHNGEYMGRIAMIAKKLNKMEERALKAEGRVKELEKDLEALAELAKADQSWSIQDYIETLLAVRIKLQLLAGGEKK
jgi:hypothetical protein